MTARIYVHPRCITSEPAHHAMQDTLAAVGFDLTRMVIGPATPKGHRELMTLVSTEPDGSHIYRRMDGSTLQHPAPKAVA